MTARLNGRGMDMKKELDANVKYQNNLKSLMAIAMVPIEDLPEAFRVWKDSLEPAMIPLARYFQVNN